MKKRNKSSAVYQPMFVFTPPEDLDPGAVLRSDVRWGPGIEELKTAPYFGLDIETYGDNAVDFRTAYVRLIQVGLPSGITLIADLGGYEDDREAYFVMYSDLFDVLRERLPNPKVLKIGANLMFESDFFNHKYNIPIVGIRDVMILSQVYWGGLKYRHSLGAIAERLGLPVDKAEQKSAWGWPLSNSQYNYAHRDAQLPIEIARQLKEKLQADKCWEFARDHCEAVRVFSVMETKGVPVDMEILDDLLIRYTERAEFHAQVFKEQFPFVDIDSPKQVTEAINNLIRSDTQVWQQHQPIMDASVESLTDFAYPWAKSLLQRRTINTQINYLKDVKSRTVDGRVGSDYHILAQPRGPQTEDKRIAATRSSSAHPNLQNAGKVKPDGLPTVREVFRAPEGYSFIISDFSNCHGRLAAEVSQDPVLCSDFREDLDLHSTTAASLATLQGLEWSPAYIRKVRKDKTNANQLKAQTLRDTAKTTFFAILNRAHPPRIQRALKTAENPVYLTLEETTAVWETARSTYKGLIDYQEQYIRNANKEEVMIDGHKYGVVRSLGGSRVFMEKNPSKWSSSWTVKDSDCVAYQWLSTEKLALIRALTKVQTELDAHPEWDAWVCNEVHDEINICCKDEYALYIAEFTMTTMNECLAEFIKSIPVNEKNADFRSCVCKSLAEK